MALSRVFVKLGFAACSLGRSQKLLRSLSLGAPASLALRSSKDMMDLLGAPPQWGGFDLGSSQV